MSIRLATEGDVEHIHSLAEEIWLQHYPPIIGEAQTQYMLARMYALDTLRAQIITHELDYYMWSEDGEEIAFAAIDTEQRDYGFISKFYLKDSYRGKGIAQEFMLQLEAIFKKAGQKEMQLTVNRQNIGAINFYFKVGFKILRCEDFDIGDGYFMNDFIMGKKLG